ncbi:MAG: lysophospholipid acyltransferase family protein, partial [Bdellovibrionales bacterium]|nr:lysophospholipid acyltransferase family protein [Bdellovibrionales bacterium]
FCKRERKIAEAQLSRALGATDSVASEVVADVFAHVGETAAEIMIGERLLASSSGGPATPFFEHHPDDALIAAWRSKTGAIALSGHLGNFELLAANYVHQGVDLSVIGRRPNYPEFAAWLEQQRSKLGLQTLWREDPRSAAKIVRAVKRGGVVGVLIDQDVNLENRFSEFFGLPAASPIGPIRIALRYRLPIVTSFSYRVARLRHVVVSHPLAYELQNDPGPEQFEEALRFVLREYNRRLEELLRAAPAQWPWWHRRWRRQPGIDYEREPEKLRSTNDYVAWLRNTAPPPKTDAERSACSN